VHRLVSYVRRTLGGRADLPLHTTAAGYVMEVPAENLDSARFLKLVGEAAGRLDGDIGPVPAIPAQIAHDVLTTVDTALLLWRGEPLADVAEHEWAAADITMLSETHRHAQELRLRSLLALGRHREAIAEARAAVTADPLRESLHGLLALALYRSERQSDALAVIAALRARLRDELGLDPGPALADLEQRVLRHDGALRVPVLAPGSDPITSARAHLTGTGDGAAPGGHQPRRAGR
jgi:DNA-binding SARP family transcriptional activator